MDTPAPYDGVAYLAGIDAASAALDAKRWNAKCPASASRDYRTGWNTGWENWGNDGLADAARAERAFGC